MRSTTGIVTVLIASISTVFLDGAPQLPAAPTVAVTRLVENPLMTVHSSPSLGGNVNGATVIRVPDWVEHPLGRYYMYFANHMGEFIRLAYADRVTGPWRVYEPGVLHVRDTAMFRPQPDPPETLADFYTHVASPEIVIDHERRQFVMWFHGWWTDGARWPAEPAAARRWANEHRYSQLSQPASSFDGLRFTAREPISRQTYLRLFPRDGQFYAMSRLGLLSRAPTSIGPFENGPNPFRDGPYAGKLRHVGLLQRGATLYVFFTAIGDAPERVLMSTIDTVGDWNGWRASVPVDVVQPEASYECVDLPNAPSAAGDIDVPVRQIRDPFVFEEAGRTYLFYSTCGEQGIAAAVITIQ